MTDLIVHEVPIRVVPTDPNLRIPDELRGIAMPAEPTEVVQARIDALMALMKKHSLSGMHWMGKGYGVGCFSLGQVEEMVDDMARVFLGRAGHILQADARRVEEPLCIETTAVRRISE